jgi:hypothetical protein
MRWTMVVVSGLGALGLGAILAVPAAAQSRVIVPIVIQAPRAGSPSGTRPTNVRVTTQTKSVQPGVTATRVTVTNTTDAGRTVGLPPATQTRSMVPVGTPSVLVTVDRRLGPNAAGTPGETRVIVSDVSQSVVTVGGPPVVSMGQVAGRGQQTFIITSEAPIDAPIVILAP